MASEANCGQPSCRGTSGQVNHSYCRDCAPWCACGRRREKCDGSRAGCVRPATATTATFSETSDGVTSYPLPPCPECGGAIVMPPARCVGRCASPAGLDAPALPAAVTELLRAAKDLVASDGFERIDGTRQTYDGGRYCDAHDRLTAALEKLEVRDGQ